MRAAILTVVMFGLMSGCRLAAQSASGAPEWQVLVRAPLPADAEPVLSVNGLTMPEQPVPEHSHPGQVVGYVVDGRIENQVAPNPPAVFDPGGFFAEAPRQLHTIMRNLGAEPAKLLVFHAGKTGVPASLLRDLPREPVKLSFAEVLQWRVRIPSTANKELRLILVTLPAQARTESAAR